MLLARNPLLSPYVASLGKAAQQNEGRHKYFANCMATLAIFSSLFCKGV